VIRPLGSLLLGCLVFWALATGLIYLGWDRLGLGETAFPRDVAVLFNTVALALCLAPMAGTLLWVSYAHRRTTDLQMMAVLGGTGLRMFVVLGAGLILTHAVPVFIEQQMTFWLWVLGVYLATLSLEIVVLVRHQATAAATAAAPQPNEEVAR